MLKSKTKINQELRKLRVLNELTYEAMAKKVGISKAYYWQIENEMKRIYYDLAVKIAKVFKKMPDEIFYHCFK